MPQPAAVDALVLRDPQPGAFIDRVSAGSQERPDRGRNVVLIWQVPQAAASLVPVGEDEPAGQRPGAAV